MAVEIIAPTGEVEVRGQSWEAVAVSEAYAVDAESEHSEVEVTTGIIVGGTPYAGAYEVDARFAEQVLPTALKTMRDDLTVHAINYTEAPNEYGTTVTIGG